MKHQNSDKVSDCIFPLFKNTDMGGGLITQGLSLKSSGCIQKEFSL